VTTDSGPGLVRALGLWDATLLVIGLVIGSAVFMVTGGPDGVARLLPSPGALLLGWIAGGLLSFAGALVFAELGAALPHAGGQYLFLREAYGDLVGFLYGWSLFAVIHTGTLAALAVGYAEYFGSFVPALGTDRILAVVPVPFLAHGLPIAAGQLNAVFVIVVLSVINYFGVKEGTVFQGIVTVMKIGSFATRPHSCKGIRMLMRMSTLFLRTLREDPAGVDEWQPYNELVHRTAELLIRARAPQLPAWLMRGCFAPSPQWR